MTLPLPRAALSRVRPLPRVLGAVRPPAITAANDDNPDPAGAALLRVALRLRLEHGPAAARHAQGRCERAFFAGDRPGYRWWREITRILDRALVGEHSRRSLPLD